MPPHAHRVVSRGKEYFYVQLHRGTPRAAKPIRLPDDPSSTEFWAAYAAALSLPAPRISDNGISKLISAYKEGPEWEGMALKTQYEWSRYLERIRDAWGALEVRGIEPHHVLALRDAYRDTPDSANNMLRCLSTMMSWSVPRKWRSDNPCREIKLLAGGEPYEPWPLEMIHLVRDHGPEWMWHATALAFYTGQRQGDCLSMRWDHVRGGTASVKQAVSLTQEKTKSRLNIPLHKDLIALLATIPKRATTILTTIRGTPWTKVRMASRRRGAAP